jgi:hypothetical protein
VCVPNAGPVRSSFVADSSSADDAHCILCSARGCNKESTSEISSNKYIMELASKEECHILKAHKLILQNWVKEKSFLLDNVAAAKAIGRGSGGAPKECCDIDTYFRLAQAIQSCTKEQSRNDWTAFHAEAFQILPPSALDLCSVVFAHWLSPSQTRRTGSGSVRSTGMVSEIADALEIGAGVGVKLMDACLTVLGTTFETSVSLIHARDVIDFVQIVAFDVEEARELYRFDSTSAAREGCPLSDCPQILRDFQLRFEVGCMKRPRMKERLEKLKADIRKRVLLSYFFHSLSEGVQFGGETHLWFIGSRSSIRCITIEAGKAVAGHFELCALGWETP